MRGKLEPYESALIRILILPSRKYRTPCPRLIFWRLGFSFTPNLHKASGVPIQGRGASQVSGGNRMFLRLGKKKHFLHFLVHKKRRRRRRRFDPDWTKAFPKAGGSDAAGPKAAIVPTVTARIGEEGPPPPSRGHPRADGASSADTEAFSSSRAGSFSGIFPSDLGFPLPTVGAGGLVSPRSFCQPEPPERSRFYPTPPESASSEKGGNFLRGSLSKAKAGAGSVRITVSVGSESTGRAGTRAGNRKARSFRGPAGMVNK